MNGETYKKTRTRRHWRVRAFWVYLLLDTSAAELWVGKDAHLRNIEAGNFVLFSRANTALCELVLNFEEAVGDGEDHSENHQDTKCLCTKLAPITLDDSFDAL